MRHRSVVAAGLGLALALGWAQLGPSDPPRRADPAPTPPRPRTLLARPPLRSPPAPAGPEAPPHEVAGDPAPDDEVPPPVAAADAPDAVRATVAQQVLEPLTACLQHQPAGGFIGKVLLDLHLDRDGLREAAVDDVTGLPDGLTDCIADAVWDAEWPAVEDGDEDGAVTVTYPVLVSRE